MDAVHHEAGDAGAAQPGDRGDATTTLAVSRISATVPLARVRYQEMLGPTVTLASLPG
jgi:hypothetical protein